MIKVVRFVAVALVGGVLATGCAYHAPTEPSPAPILPSLAPSTIRITVSSRSDQTVGITATVLSSDGHFVPSVTLTLSVDAGTVSPTTATTDANGVVQATAATPSATTLHVAGAGLSAQASLPSSLASPVADAVLLNVPGSGTAGVPVTMFVSSAASGPWAWSFGDGQTAQTTTLSTTHTYGQAGRFTVTVAGASTTVSAPITINNPPTPPTPPSSGATTGAIECTAAAHGSPTGCHATVTASDGTALTATINSVQWDWGDGQVTQSNTSSAAVATHTYVVAGSYVVNAVIKDTGGDTVTAQATVKIS